MVLKIDFIALNLLHFTSHGYSSAAFASLADIAGGRAINSVPAHAWNKEFYADGEVWIEGVK